MLSCDLHTSMDAERKGDALSCVLSGGRTGAFEDLEGSSMISKSGVNKGMMSFQVLGMEAPGDGGGRVGVCRRTTSCHFSHTESTMWSFQLTASRKAISFVLISQTLSPEILLHARAE